jgi:hypothetical protein
MEIDLSKPGIRVPLNSENNVSGIVHGSQSSTNQCANNDSNHLSPWSWVKSQVAALALSRPVAKCLLPAQAGDVLPETIVTTNPGWFNHAGFSSATGNQGRGFLDQMNSSFRLPFGMALGLIGVLGYSGCTETVVYRQPPPTVVVDRGPYPPPPPQAEYRPPAPPYPVVWVRGHWRWNGYRYVWIRGHYRPV